jgi:RecJ-like exonuclease
VVAAWTARGKLRSAAKALAKAITKHGDLVIRLARDTDGMDRAVAGAANGANDLLAELDELEPPDEVYIEVRRRAR